MSFIMYFMFWCNMLCMTLFDIIYYVLYKDKKILTYFTERYSICFYAISRLNI